ncbi:hypothetical protein AAFF_G00042020 [Aldrovandia affinis]|uniref:Uncharacterized protein n=1 Tax=Aldrovandia affinis TaxID=143900 RepID=A0AAD7S2N4_9TELE|nr:hypothetical protein AAFF_G00042020 [Aldrovandia affinis]
MTRAIKERSEKKGNERVHLPSCPGYTAWSHANGGCTGLASTESPARVYEPERGSPLLLSNGLRAHRPHAGGDHERGRAPGQVHRGSAVWLEDRRVTAAPRTLTAGLIKPALALPPSL